MKKLTTQATIESIAKKENEKPIVESVIAFIKQTDNICLTSEKIADIKTALNEAVKNVITFAYLNKQGKISVSFAIYDSKLLEIKVTDYGCGIEDIDKARDPFFTTKENSSGMGFAFIEAFSDKLTVNSTLGKGTIVTMEFELL